VGATWFDRLRGESQGRIVPTGRAAAHGDRAFVLGADAAVIEPALLGVGDWTEIRQVVDLTEYDLLTATLDTIGRVLIPWVDRSVWRTGIEDELARWTLDQAPEAVPDLVDGGPPLVGALAAGDLELGAETYSPDGALCRVVPIGSTTGQLVGQNDPQIIPGTLVEYTLQAWIDFNTAAHVASAGVNATVFDMLPLIGTSGGLRVRLVGVAGPGVHEWLVELRHKNGGTTQTATFAAPVIDAAPGWGMLSIRYDFMRAAALQADVCWNDATIAPAGISLVPPAPAALGQLIRYGSADLVGGLSAVRLVGRRLDDAELAASWAECTTAPPAVRLAWRMQILIDGVVFAEHTIAEDEDRRWTDWAIPVRRYTGTHDVAFRLALGPA
jgi:hypothetical protein